MREAERYSLLLKEIRELLSHPQYFDEDIEDLRDLFIYTYYEALKISFGYSLDIEEFKKFANSNMYSDRLEQLKFVSKTVESEKGYSKVNEVLEKFRDILVKNIKER